MDDSPFGLTACIFTSDVERAEAFAARVDVGTVFMNRCDYLDPLLPWTGAKASGAAVDAADWRDSSIARASIASSCDVDVGASSRVLC